MLLAPTGYLLLFVTNLPKRRCVTRTNNDNFVPIKTRKELKLSKVIGMYRVVHRNYNNNKLSFVIKIKHLLFKIRGRNL